jgi:predicted ATPase
VEQAIEWWDKAGDAALRRSAYIEATSHLGKAIEMADKEGEVQRPQALLATLDESEAVRRERRNREIRAKYAQAVMITEGYTSDVTEAAYRRIGGEHEGPSQAPERWPVLYNQWLKCGVSGDIEAALATAQTQLREGEKAGLPAMAAYALRQISLNLIAFGRFAEARRHAERARERYDASWGADARAVTGLDFLALSECTLERA